MRCGAETSRTDSVGRDYGIEYRDHLPQAPHPIGQNVTNESEKS